MNDKAREHFKQYALKEVFSDDPVYLCERLFEGSWGKMYDYIVDKMGECSTTMFPDPNFTDITTYWTDEDYDEHRIFVCDHWAGHQMGYALEQTYEDAYCAVWNALKCGITLEDLDD